MQLLAAGTTTGYNLFVRLGLSGGAIALEGLESHGAEACLNANQFDYPIIGSTSTAMIAFGPFPQWAPSVWTFRGGMFEGVGGAC